MLERLVVHKYGGSSVGTLEKIRHVASHIQRTVAEGTKVLVVVSAMGSYTDELLALAYQLSSSPAKRELDMLLTTGERISTSLLSIALQTLGVASISLTGSQSGILTDGNHGNARIQEVRSDRVSDALRSFPVVIVAGFQGVCPRTKDITSLGRGGSDLTGVALAVAHQASSCEIYSDVPGVMSADPRLVPEAHLLAKVSWQEMVDLAWAGAQVLHHRAAFLAQKNQLCLEIRSSYHPEIRGTLIGGFAPMERPYVSALTYKKNQSQLIFTIQVTQGLGFSPLLVALEKLWGNQESPLLVQQSWQGENTYQMRVICESSLAAQLIAEFEEACRENSAKMSACQERGDLGALAVVGHGFRQSQELVALVHQQVGGELYYSDMQDHLLTLLVQGEQAEECLRKLHRALKAYFRT